MSFLRARLEPDLRKGQGKLLSGVPFLVIAGDSVNGVAFWHGKHCTVFGKLPACQDLIAGRMPRPREIYTKSGSRRQAGLVNRSCETPI
jgi:hypothetical protein